MAEKLDERKEIVQKEFLVSQVLQLDALIRLLIKKGVFTEGEFSRQLKQIENEYERKKGITE